MIDVAKMLDSLTSPVENIPDVLGHQLGPQYEAFLSQNDLQE